MRAPTQSEITAFFQGRATMAEEIEAAIARAKSSKKSIEKAVLETMNMQNWHLRAEMHGYDPEPAPPPSMEQALTCAAIAIVALLGVAVWVTA